MKLSCHLLGIGCFGYGVALAGCGVDASDADEQGLRSVDPIAVLGTNAATTPISGRVIVKFRGDSTRSRSLAARPARLAQNRALIEVMGGRFLRHLDMIDAVAAELSAEQVADLRESSEVEYVEVDPIRELIHPMAASSAAITPQAETVPYGITLVQADQVSDANISNRKVCIVDTGYSGTHEDLRNVPGTNLSGIDNDGLGNDTGTWSNDGYGHGTHVAGTISAIKGNGKGVVGISGSNAVGLYIVKVFNDSGSWAYGSDLVAAVQQCVAAGANVISMSLGGSGSSTAERTAFDNAFASGVLSIAAAGNGGNTSLSYPASYDSVVSVAAVNSSKSLASFSQRNAAVDLAAPGVGVLSTLPGNTYEAWDGTSMATPHVSGVAALVWSNFPTCTNANVRDALTATAEDLGTAGRDNSYGYGLVRAKAAFDYLTTNGCAGGGDGGGTCSATTLNAADLPISIPDNNSTGVRTSVTSTLGGTVAALTVQANITHTYRGDLIVTLIAPSGTTYTLSNRAGGSADNLVINTTLSAAVGQTAAGTWQLRVQDRAAQDVGTINSFALAITPSTCN